MSCGKCCAPPVTSAQCFTLWQQQQQQQQQWKEAMQSVVDDVETKRTEEQEEHSTKTCALCEVLEVPRQRCVLWVCFGQQPSTRCPFCHVSVVMRRHATAAQPQTMRTCTAWCLSHSKRVTACVCARRWCSCTCTIDLPCTLVDFVAVCLCWGLAVLVVVVGNELVRHKQTNAQSSTKTRQQQNTRQ